MPKSVHFFTKKINKNKTEHCNVLKVYGYTMHPFKIITKHHNGVNILKYCNDNKLNTLQILKLALQIAKGILHLHKHNIIHGHICHQNVFVTSKLTQTQTMSYNQQSIDTGNHQMQVLITEYGYYQFADSISPFLATVSGFIFFTLLFFSFHFV